MADDTVVFEWRGAFTNVEVNRLHAEAFKTRVFDESEWNWRELTARRIGVRLVHAAREGAARAGCDFLHVDFDEPLRRFYIDECGFEPVCGGLLRLR